MLSTILLLILIGVALYFLNQPGTPVIGWIKKVVNIIAVVFVCLLLFSLAQAIVGPIDFHPLPLRR